MLTCGARRLVRWWCCGGQAYGVFEQRGGNLRRAMELFNQALSADPKHSATWLAKAQVGGGGRTASGGCAGWAGV